MVAYRTNLSVQNYRSHAFDVVFAGANQTALQQGVYTKVVS